MILWRLILAHFISDFVLQNRWIVRNKAHFSGLAVHSLIYFGVALVCLLGRLNPQVVAILFTLALLHGLVDYVKGQCRSWMRRMEWLLFVLDQGVHGLTLMLAAGLISSHDQQVISSLMHLYPAVLFFKYASLMLLTVVGGIHFTNAVLESTLEMDTELEGEQERSSCIIGVAERFLITLAVLIGHYELIAFLIAAKSIIRLPEVRSDHTQRREAYFSNYFLVGTFVSYAWALSIAILFKSMFL